MKIGMDIGTSKSPDAATFETGPAYNYSFAMDFSKLTTDDINVGTTVNTNFPSVTNTSRFISVADADVLAGGDGILLEMKTVEAGGNVNGGNIGFPGIDNAADADDETLVKSSFTSSSSDGIPNGSISDVYRYVSLVLTYHSQNSLGASLTDDNITGAFEIHDAAGNKYGGGQFHGDKGGGKDYPRFINGVDISVDFASSGRDGTSGLLTSGTDEFDIPLTLTWDMEDAVAASGFSALTGPIDPAEMKYQLGGGQQAVTFHGFVFSKQVPGAVTLPIHTSRPDAAFA